MSVKSFLFQNATLKQSLFKNSFWISLAFFISKLLKFFLIPFAVRILGPEQYGIFSYCVSILGSLFLFSDIGLSIYFTREMIQNPELKQTLIGTVFRIKLLLWSMISLISLAFMAYSKTPAIRLVFLTLLIMTLIDSIKQFFHHIFYSQHHFQYESISLIIETVITTISGLIFLLYFRNTIGFALGYLLGSICSFSYTLWISKSISLSGFDTALLRPILIKTWPFLGIILMKFLLVTTDIVMIKWLKGYSWVGYYQAAFKISTIGFSIMAILGAPLSALIAAVHSSTQNLNRIVSQGFRAFFALGAPVLVGGIFFAPEIIHQIAGTEFDAAIPSFRLFVICIFFQKLWSLLSYIITAKDYLMINLKISIICIFSNILLNLLIIPHYGITGATCSTLISTILEFTISYYVLRNRLQITVPFLPFLKYLFISSIVFLGISSFWIPTWNIVFIMIGLNGLYMILLGIFKDPVILDFLSIITKRPNTPQTDTPTFQQ